MKTKELTLGTLNIGDVFIFAGIKFTVNHKSYKPSKPNQDYMINVIIGETKKGCYMSNLALVEVFAD